MFFFVARIDAGVSDVRVFVIIVRYPLRQATNYVVPSSSGSFGRFPAVGSGAFFRVLDATKLLGHELPNGYSALAEPVAPPVAEWRHWRLAVLATALLLLLAVNVIRL